MRLGIRLAVNAVRIFPIRQVPRCDLGVTEADAICDILSELAQDQSEHGRERTLFNKQRGCSDERGVNNGTA